MPPLWRGWVPPLHRKKILVGTRQMEGATDRMCCGTEEARSFKNRGGIDGEKHTEIATWKGSWLVRCAWLDAVQQPSVTNGI